ncbi:hypothetical protein PS2_005569 [Malus domestica]
MWRKGPLGPKSLCNRCGIRYRKMKMKEEMEREGKRASEVKALLASNTNKPQEFGFGFFPLKFGFSGGFLFATAVSDLMTTTFRSMMTSSAESSSAKLSASSASSSAKNSKCLDMEAG